MSHDGLGRSRSGRLRGLIARRRFDEAIELLRSEVEGRGANPQARMQLADVLVLSGRPIAASQVLTESASASRTGPGRSSNSTAPLM